MKKFIIYFLSIFILLIITIGIWGFFIYSDVQKLKDMGLSAKRLDHNVYNDFFIQAEKVQKEILPIKSILNYKPDYQKQFETLTKIIEAKEILRNILGIEEVKTYLVVMQNNTELRPSGGFWGTYGILKIENGKIISFTTKDSHTLDIQNMGKFIAPVEVAPVFEDQWRFWNANWSPDFKVSVKQGLFFYNQVDPNLKFDGVIGPNIDFLLSLLKITGPINVPGKDFQISHENFIQKLIYEPSDPIIFNTKKDDPGFVVGSLVKKPLLGELGEILFTKIANIRTYSSLTNIAENIFLSLDKQNLILYFDDDELEKLIDEKKWSGKLNSDGNFAMVVDANLGSKLDFTVDKKAIFKNLSNNRFQVTLNYKNTYDQTANTDNQGITTYRSLTRIFIPKGSKIISASGGQIESELILDTQTNTSFIASMFILEPNEEQNITIIWEIPTKIANEKLNVLKQAGNHIKLEF